MCVRLLVVAALLGLLGPLQAGVEKKVSPRQPNIVVVLADDLGWGDLGCYGHPVIKTPHLDAFAKQGLRLTQCYSASSVCSPSRSALLTGRTPYRNGVFTWIPEGSNVHLQRTEVTLSRLLKAIGYTTCHVGKWHLNGLFNQAKQPQPDDHGFDWWLATQNNAAPSHKDPRNFARNGKAVGPMQGYSAELIVDEAIGWLKKERDRKKPFYLQVWFHEPHLPIETDPKFQGLYPDLVKKDPNQAQHHGNVSQLDFAFGKLMKTLEDLGLAEDTIVVFTSDNGPEGNGMSGRTRGSTGGLRGRKRSMYEGGIRVPGIFRWPGRIPAGKTSEEPAIGSDIFTTLCRIAGAKVPSDRPIDGADLAPIFTGGKVERTIPMYWRYHGAPGPFKMGMRVGDWKILADAALTKFELYDLGKDPRQADELSGKHPEVLKDLQEKLTRLNAEIEREGPTWWKNYDQKKKGKKKKKDAPKKEKARTDATNTLPENLPVPQLRDAGPEEVDLFRRTVPVAAQEENQPKEKKKQDKTKDRIKEIAGTAEFLNQLPKKFARLVAVDPATGRVTLHPEGEAKESNWTLVPDGEIKVHGFWGRLEDLQIGDRVWAWFHIDRKGKANALAMLADEISQQDLNGTPWEVLEVDGKRLQLKGKLGKTRELNHAGLEAPAKGSRLYIQSAGDSVRLACSEKDLDKHRLAQKKRQEERWQADGLPGAAGFVHIFSGEMDALLDHQGMRWGRSLTPGDKVALQPLDAAGKPSVAAIAGVVKAIAPFRDRTQVRLVVKNRELSDLAPGQRLRLKMPPPADKTETLLPPDLDRPHGDKQERIEWFLASIYCTCGVKGDRCTGHFYTLSSCNPNACGMPNQMRRTLGKLIDAGLSDRQILEEMLRQKGPNLLRPHLLP